VSLRAHVGQCRAHHALHARHVHVEDAAHVLGRHQFLDSVGSDPGIVEQTSRPPSAAMASATPGFGAGGVRHVHLDDPRAGGLQLRHSVGVPPRAAAHAARDRVPAVQQRQRRGLAEAARDARDKTFAMVVLLVSRPNRTVVRRRRPFFPD
jgi:hypothetical protein